MRALLHRSPGRTFLLVLAAVAFSGPNGVGDSRGATSQSRGWASRTTAIDIHSVPTTALPKGGLEPVAAVAVDLDGDGIVDLASFFSTSGGGGSVVIRRGAAAGGHFEPTARVVPLADAPSFAAAGDFD